MFIKLLLVVIIIAFIITILSIVAKAFYLIFSEWNSLSLQDQKERIKLKSKLKKLGLKI